MYGSRAVTLLVLISDDVINRILKLDIQTNILVYVTRCCTDLTSKVLKERTFGQSSALLWTPFGVSKLKKEAAQDRLSLHMSKYHIVGNHVSRLIYHIDEHARLRQACAYAQSLQSLLCSCSFTMFWCTVNRVLTGHSKKDKTMVLKTYGSLMKVESIVECSNTTFDLH